MNKKGVIRELHKARCVLSIIEASARIEGLNGLAEGMSKIRGEILEWRETIEKASEITFPEKE